MAGSIPEATIARIIDNTDIVDLVGRYIPLKKAGRDYRALCPFHNEKTPSFHVSPQRQMFHCFGCGKGGDAIAFVMEMDKVPFVEAVEMLGDRCGVRIEHQSGFKARTAEKRKTLYDVTRWAARIFARNLNSEEGAVAREYMTKRGISSDSVQAFSLGYSIDGWQLINTARDAGADVTKLEGTGLVITNEKGNQYDRFRGRLMFPIFDTQERVVGFGARALNPDENAKYLNSPETSLFAKSKLLYGLNRAKGEIIRTGKAIVVEGYTDVIMAHQHGITNVVATLGTALGRDHIRQLKRYAPLCVLVFDGDAAGQKASDASISIFLEEEMEVTVAVLPEGKDPCDCILELGPDAFRNCLDNAFDVFDLKMRAAPAGNKLDPKQAAAVADQLLELVAHIPNRVERRLALDRVAAKLHDRLHVPEAAIRKRMMEIAGTSDRRRNNVRQKREEIDVRQEPPATEKEIMTVCLQEPALFARLITQITLDDLTHEGLRRIFIAASESIDANGRMESAMLSAKIAQNGDPALLASLMSGDGGCIDYTDRFEGCLKNLEQYRVKQKVAELKEQMASAAKEGDKENLKRLYHEILSIRSTIGGNNERN